MSYSQANQDLFAMFVCEPFDNRTFLDIGCSAPHHVSNSRLLLENGWTGTGIDIEDFSEQWKNHPSMTVLCGDATTFDWSKMMLSPHYLSLDCDNASHAALMNLINKGVQFRCATIEHDAYRLGDAMRNDIRGLMAQHGYEMVAGDITHDGCPFEDWWIHPDWFPGAVDEIKNHCWKLREKP